ncbi:MAG: peroxiredoxin [Polyangiaceae bacterium]
MRSLRPAFILLAPALVLGCKDDPPPTGNPPALPPTTATASAAASGAPAAALAVGSPAPEVTFTLHDGKEVPLSSLSGEQVLVYFYPKDDTPGCTTEAKGLKEQWDALQAAGVKVFGVSTQDEASHKAFIDKYELPFPLVVDTDGSIAAAFEVPLKGGFAARQSFLVGKDGKLAAVWRDVDPATHAETVLAAAKGG